MMRRFFVAWRYRAIHDLAHYLAAKEHKYRQDWLDLLTENDA